MIISSFPCHLFSQSQLDIQGDPASPDTVAIIRANYSGASNTVGLKVHSAPEDYLGIGGVFYGGSNGMQGLSTTGAGVIGRSDEGTGVYGVSTHAGVLGFSLTELGGYHTFDQEGGVVGYSNFAPGVYGQSTDHFGIQGVNQTGPAIVGTAGNGGVNINGNLTGVIGMSLTDNLGFARTARIGVWGVSDSIGVLGHSIKSDGYGVLGTTSAFRGRSVKGVAYGSSSIGVMGIAQEANSTGVWGEGKTGGFFKGSDGTAIQLGGVASQYSTTAGADDAVIRSQKTQNHGDLFLVSNDEVAIHLDDDNNSEGHFKIFNGDTVQILSIDENGNLTVAGNCYCANSVASKDIGRSLDKEINRSGQSLSQEDRELDPEWFNSLKPTSLIKELLEKIAFLEAENKAFKNQMNNLTIQLAKLESSF
ncbi:MAG: hypothetical protein HKN76_01180 [Saprospiraceae bacterium]|nr:hypothetical protein [Saprospiraceae bacterium]